MENQNRLAKGVLVFAGIVLVLCVGMVIGGGVVYGALQIADLWPGTGREAVVVQLDDLPDMDSVQVFTPGAAVVEVVPGGPAERAGLRKGDIIVAVDGRRVGMDADLADLITRYRPGDRVDLELWQASGDSRQLSVQLGEHPEKDGVAYLGVSYSSSMGRAVPERIRPFLEQEFESQGERWMPHWDSIRGAVILSVADDSPASQAGLEAGDIITAVDGQPVGDSDALVEVIGGYRPGDRATLTVVRSGDDAERQVRVRLGEHPDRDGKAYLGVWTGTMHMEGVPGLEGGELPHGPGFFQMPHGMPLDELPFDLDDLPFNLHEAPSGEGEL